MKRWKLRTNLQLKFLVMGLWMVLMSLSLRLAAMTPAGSVLARLDARQLWQIAGECLSAQNVTADTASEKVELPEKPPDTTATAPQEEPPDTTAMALQEEPEPEIVPITFTGQEAEAIAIGGSAQSTVDKASLLLSPLKMHPDAEPQVLIVHTHTSEAYTPEEGWEYEPTDEYRTLNPEYNVVRVGEEIARELRNLGIAVIHDTTVNDDPQYQGAYERSYDCIAAQLAAHPSIQIVLDIHRDAAEDEEGNALPRQTVVNDESCAQLMLVVGTDEGGLAHPNWRENLAFALKLQALLNRTAPTLCRDLSLRTERFNQHFTPCSLLVEVGAAGNTLAETLPSARYLARALATLVEASSATDQTA